MTILVIAEHDNKTLNNATLHAVEAASQISSFSNDSIHLLIAGFNCAEVATAASHIAAIDTVICADNSVYEHHLSENISQLVCSLAADYSYIIAAASSAAKSTLPRVAALLDVTQVSEIIQVIDANTYQRPIYAGNALATVRSSESTQVISVRTTGFAAASIDSSASAQIVESTLTFDTPNSTFVSNQIAANERPDLTGASVIISGGRGMANADNFSLLTPVADKLNAAVGASRAAVDAGFVSNDLQVGQTGKIVAPDLYIAVGISGAIQHLAGMKDSKVIVAINSDADAPIFSVADYGLVADLFDALPELSEKLG